MLQNTLHKAREAAARNKQEQKRLGRFQKAPSKGMKKRPKPAIAYAFFHASLTGEAVGGLSVGKSRSLAQKLCCGFPKEVDSLLN